MLTYLVRPVYLIASAYMTRKFGISNYCISKHVKFWRRCNTGKNFNQAADDIVLISNCVLMKVQFWGTNTLTAVETQGFPSGTGCVTLYRLEISLDCLTFLPIKDDSGNNKVFTVVKLYITLI